MLFLSASIKEMRPWFLRRKWLLLMTVCFGSCYLVLHVSFTLPRSDNLKYVDFFSKLEISRTPFASKARIPRRTVHSVNCNAILNGDKQEAERAGKYLNRTSLGLKGVSDKEYILLTQNCDTFFKVRDYSSVPISQEEKDMPIAYSILLYKDVEQAERLLRAIYRPHNMYCLHVDMFSNPTVHAAIKSIADCFSNVFVVSRQEYIVYAGFARLQADLNCMQDLLRKGKTWKYFINLPSQQFPIKTNLEIAKILHIYNGANDIEGLTGRRRLDGRFNNRFVYKMDDPRKKPKLMKSNQKKGDPPYNVTVVKGSAYGIFSRKFVEFIINNNTARDLLDWVRDVYSPDEYFWATLHYNPKLGTPGAFYTGKPDKKPWLAVYANWGEYKCFGRFVHGVCVFGAGDLHRITRRNELFVNKLYLDYQPLALDCIEEWYLNRTALNDVSANMTYYKALPFIKKQKQTLKL